MTIVSWFLQEVKMRNHERLLQFIVQVSNEVLEFKIIMNIIMIVQYLTNRKVKKDIPIPNQSLLISKSLSALCVLCALSLSLCVCVSALLSVSLISLIYLISLFGAPQVRRLYEHSLSLSAAAAVCGERKKETAICRLAYKNKKVLLFLYVDAPVTGNS